MKHKIVIDGEEKQLDIRPMDETFIVARKLWEPPIKPTDPLEDSESARILGEFIGKQNQAMGSCAILAWEGDGVIGKMRFTTREMYDAFRRQGGGICMDNEETPKIMQRFSDEELAGLWASQSRTIFVTCFNIGHFDARYQRQGISGALVKCLKEWAREHGWRRIEARSCPDIVPFRCRGPQNKRRGWWERQGFSLAEEIPIPLEQVEWRRKEIEQIAAGNWEQDSWDAKTYWWNLEKVQLLAADPAWRSEYDKDYLMACDL